MGLRVDLFDSDGCSDPGNHGTIQSLRGLVSSREGIDILVALNQETIFRHRAELAPGGIIIYDAAQVGDLPPGVQTLALKAGDLLPEAKSGEVAINARACGAILGRLKLPLEPLLAFLTRGLPG